MKLLKDIRYVGVNDRKSDLFEGQYVVPNGISYNSYIILDEKIAVFDTVDKEFKEEWLSNVERELDGKTPNYLIVQHMEPDHSANIAAFIALYPNVKIVASAKAFVMMKNFFGEDYPDRQVVVEDNTELCLGAHTLVFITAPMVHWPEVIMAYEKSEKVLFSADAFGKFGALDVEDDWACEARRYYFGIVGKYGTQVQNVFKKLSAFDIQAICPLHGPTLLENLEYYFDLYHTWSTYGVESEGVVIAYTSVYGNTKKAVLLLEEELKKRGCKKVVVNDLARMDMAEAVEDAFRYGNLILATTTYNGEIFPFMREFIQHLMEHNFQKRKIGFIENGSWAPMATRVMKALLEKCKDLSFATASVKILSSLSEENLNEIRALADEFCDS